MGDFAPGQNSSILMEDRIEFPAIDFSHVHNPNINGISNQVIRFPSIDEFEDDEKSDAGGEVTPGLTSLVPLTSDTIQDLTFPSIAIHGSQELRSARYNEERKSEAKDENGLINSLYAWMWPNKPKDVPRVRRTSDIDIFSQRGIESDEDDESEEEEEVEILTDSNDESGNFANSTLVEREIDGEIPNTTLIAIQSEAAPAQELSPESLQRIQVKFEGSDDDEEKSETPEFPVSLPSIQDQIREYQPGEASNNVPVTGLTRNSYSSVMQRVLVLAEWIRDRRLRSPEIMSTEADVGDQQYLEDDDPGDDGEKRRRRQTFSEINRAYNPRT